MTGAQFKAALAARDMTHEDAAELLGVSYRTITNYANDGPIPEAVAKLLRLMVKLKLKPEGVK